MNFYDYHRITPVKSNIIDINFKDSYVPGMGRQRGLEVILDATHAGTITRNIKGYIPSRMEDGAKSFVNRRKPAKILKHHKLDEDPVGIVLDSTYVPTIPDFLKNDKNVKILTDSSYSIDKQIKAFNRLIADGIPFSSDWNGLGLIRLKSVILDEESIEMIRDGRFDAVSTNFQSPGHIYCSQCQQNLISDGPCEHQVGEIYENEDGSKSPCIIIPGVHSYIECSLVNVDADPLTTIRFEDDKKTYELSRDCLEKDIYTTEPIYEFKDFKIEEDHYMAKKLTDEEVKLVDKIKTLRPELEEKNLNEKAQVIFSNMKDGKFHPDQEDSGLTEDEVISNLLDSLDFEDAEVNADEIYEEMKVTLKDKALSADKIKKLPKSNFCGPNKSFPAPDSDHVVAAISVLKDYKGPVDKTEVLAKLNRKAKALGSSLEDVQKDKTESKPEEKETSSKDSFNVPTTENLKALSDTEIKSIFDMAEVELINRGQKLDRPCAHCSDKDSKIEELNAKITEDSKIVEESKDQLKYLRIELRNQATEYSALADELFNVELQLRDSKLEKASVYGFLSGNYKSVEEATDSLKNENIDEKLVSFVDKVDFEKLSNKLSDGMSNVPEGTIEDPTAKVESDLELIFSDANLSAPAKAAITNIKDMLEKGKVLKAKQYYGKMVSMKILDKSLIKFEMFDA